jgi:signal transduction histidine kinase
MFISWKRLVLAVAVVVGFLAYLYFVADFGRSRLADAGTQVRQSQARRILIGDLQQLLSDAESGHRGFLLTGDPRYLEPLQYAGERVNQTADELVASYEGEDPDVLESARRLRYVAGEKLGELNASVALYRGQGPEAALSLARTGAGEKVMEKFRNLARAVRDYEAVRVERALHEWRRQLSIVGWMNLGASVLNIALLTLAGFVVFRDIRRRSELARELERERTELANESQARAKELTEVYGYLQRVQEDERFRLSRGLHDELGGLLLAARMDVSWLQRHTQSPPEAIQERLMRVQKTLDEGINLKRRVVEELRPSLLDNMGLLAALRWQMEESCGRAGLKCIENFPDTEPQLLPNAAIALFRVVQEAMVNIVKHAKAKTVEVSLSQTPTELLLTVRDDGIGIPPGDYLKPQAHGLSGMMHRIYVLGGQLSVERGARGGTEVRVRVPLANVLAPASSQDPNLSGKYRRLSTTTTQASVAK